MSNRTRARETRLCISRLCTRLICASLVSLAACAGNGFQPPDVEAEIEGTITEVGGISPASVLVEVNPAEQSGSRKIWFRLTDETQLLRWNADAGGYGTIERADLTVGRRVRAWSIGPIAESYPEQATAHTIVLLDED